MLRPLLAAFGLALLTACTPAPTPTRATVTASNYTPDAQSARVIALINAERAKQGLRAVSVDRTLTNTAAAHGTLMVQKGFFSHNIPGGMSFPQRMAAAGIGSKYTGENIFTGPLIPEVAVTNWMQSRGHRHNILDGNFTKIGVASAGGRYWVSIFSSD